MPSGEKIRYITATTAAPVVWLAGDTKPHEKEIEAAGGKWSGKKNAYYFRVA